MRITQSEIGSQSAFTAIIGVIRKCQEEILFVFVFEVKQQMVLAERQEPKRNFLFREAYFLMGGVLLNTMIKNLLRGSFGRATFLLDEKRIEKDEFIEQYTEIIFSLLSNSIKERGIILHFGTCLPFYLTTILACFKSFLSNGTDQVSVIDELSTGDLVIYRNKRGVYKGKDDEGRVVIENSDRGILTVNRVPLSLAHTISPYYGSAKTLDGRGVRNNANSKKLISKLFEMRPEEIRSIFDKSIIVVCEKSEADSIMNRLSIMINKKAVKIGELFPSAYYTPNDINFYSGNSAKVEPLIKYTNKLSVARELIIENEGIETLIVDGSKYYTEDVSELSSIYNRSSLKSLILLGELSKTIDSSAINSLENIKSFIWTKEKLLNINQRKQQINNDISQESKKLRNMLDNFLNCEVKKVELGENLEHHLFFECKKELYHLSRQKNVIESINSFLIKGYWLLNLLERSFFPLSVMEKLVSSGQINSLSPSRELEDLRMITNEFDESPIKEKMKIILSHLSILKNDLDFVNPKYNCLLELIRKNMNKTIAVIGSKTYYQKVFLEAAPEDLREIIENCLYYIPNKYDSNILLDELFVVGINEWNKLNPLLISNTKALTFLIYLNEKIKLLKLEVHTEKKIRLLNYNHIDKDENNLINTIDMVAASTEELNETTIEGELENIIGSISFSHAVSEIKVLGQGGIQTSEIKRVAILETGEKVFFTNNYVPYVFDYVRQSVLESDVSSLVPGDHLIFTNYDSDTRDIVEKVMGIFVNSKDCNESFRTSYRKSFRWKIVLKEYMRRNNLTFRDLSNIMSQKGKSKHEATIRTWFDEESHIVGPRDSETYHLIGKITRDPDMLKNSESYFESCREVRSMRIRILKYIGKCIIQTYKNNNELPEDEILSNLSIDVSKMSRVIQIDKLIEVENLIIPSHSANRPQNL